MIIRPLKKEQDTDKKLLSFWRQRPSDSEVNGRPVCDVSGKWDFQENYNIRTVRFCYKVTNKETKLWEN